MGIIRNPADIVGPYVADYQAVLGESLVSVLMYGSAVTHEYRPGKSDINTIVILANNGIMEINKCLPVVAKWRKKKVSEPFFMTKAYIDSSLDCYPIEFVNMRSAYKVLFGEDVLNHLDIKKEHVRVQCERELKGISLHLRREFSHCGINSKKLSQVVLNSEKNLLPIFKALLVLYDRGIPKMKNDVVRAVEELFELGISVFTTLYITGTESNVTIETFTSFTDTIDSLISFVNNMK